MVEQKEVLEGFKKEISNQIVSLQDDLKNLKKQSKSYETYFITSLKNTDLKKRQVEDLRKFSRDINKTINEQIKEIKQLPFVKEVRFTAKGINIDVGRIEISYRDNNIYIGDFTIMITPNGVDIKNRNPIIDNNEGILVHPHIKNKVICYGDERRIKIIEYFAKFQLKQLVYMVYLFLKTYSERDNYNSITFWTQEAKRKERKQRVEINTKRIVGEINGNR